MRSSRAAFQRCRWAVRKTFRAQCVEVLSLTGKRIVRVAMAVQLHSLSACHETRQPIDIIPLVFCFPLTTNHPSAVFPPISDHSKLSGANSYFNSH